MGVERGWQSLVLSMDFISFLRFHLATSHKPEVLERLLHGKRGLTLYQNNVSWKAIQDFVKASNPVKGGVSPNMGSNEFFQFLGFFRLLHAHSKFFVKY